jgi:hypothetical protein
MVITLNPMRHARQCMVITQNLFGHHGNCTVVARHGTVVPWHQEKQNLKFAQIDQKMKEISEIQRNRLKFLKVAKSDGSKHPPL